MTNKQIIIDGIDVSKCYNFSHTEEHYCDECSSEFGCAVCDERTICYYKQLKAKEQECERWKKDNDVKNELLAKLGCPTVATARRKVFTLQQQIDTLKEDNEKMSKGYAELTEIVSPYIDDFTGYNEKLGGFDIVLCVKELLQQFKLLKTENEKIKESRDYYKRIVDGCPDVCENGFCQIDFYNKKLTKTLAEIKDIAETISLPMGTGKSCYRVILAKQIIQKISECEGNNDMENN